MTSRERVEDLGRIAQLLHSISDNEVFEWTEGRRNKDAAEWFQSLPSVRQFDKIHSLAYSLSDMQDKISEAYQIARWGDEDETT